MALTLKQLQRKRERKALKRRDRKNQLCAPITRGYTFVGDFPPSGGVRMSEIISHLAEPIVEELSDSPDDLERIINLTIAAWNLTMFPADLQKQQYEKLANRFFGTHVEASNIFRWICDLVAQRKQHFYPRVNCTIFDVHFRRDSDSSVYFEVAYTYLPEELPPESR